MKGRVQTSVKIGETLTQCSRSKVHKGAHLHMRIARNAKVKDQKWSSCQGYILMSSMNIEPITFERILDRDNLKKAYKKVVANKGSAGVDDMEVFELANYILEHPGEISESVRNGKYRPKPIKRVYIPKDNGEQRPLGIPTVIDRFVQQAVALVLSKEYE